MLQRLKQDPGLSSNADIQTRIADMDLLACYLQALGDDDRVSFDLSLARGLDYYTSLIYEVLYQPSNPQTPAQQGTGQVKSMEESSQVGSLAAGGHYDSLVGLYSKRAVLCVGISFGVDRLYTNFKARRDKEDALPMREIDVYVMAFGGKEFDRLLPE
jgi:histidyl-tRNA synthetase